MPTFAEAILCLRRFRRVATPICASVSFQIDFQDAASLTSEFTTSLTIFKFGSVAAGAAGGAGGAAVPLVESPLMGDTSSVIGGAPRDILPVLLC
jgi:hypothetical protein